jgi:hypothetical protein
MLILAEQVNKIKPRILKIDKNYKTKKTLYKIYKLNNKN